MSTRALRKLQREQERSRQLADVEVADGSQDTVDSDEEVEVGSSRGKAKSRRKKKNKVNTFEMLEQAEEEEDMAEKSGSDEDVQPEQAKSPETLPARHSVPKKKKKKRSKPKNSGLAKVPVANARAEAGDQGNEMDETDETDEIDRALQELSLQKASASPRPDGDFYQENTGASDRWEMAASKLLSIEPQRLNPTNEMRSLFGSIVLESAPRNQDAPEEGGRMDLETALRGRHSPASRGRELGNLAKRRNILMQGRENWPLATSGGLGMEILEDARDSDSATLSSNVGKQYHIVHNSAYQETHQQFRRAVESMSAENMIHLLVLNPYHIASLLQVAEIAKHQGDHSVTGDLLERALFTFGRSVHSTFSVSVRQGLARLRFDESPSRELYLAIWRYIQNLEMRGTWRTAFEWSKILLSFNILSDPCGITHALDQYALRGRQHEALIALCSDEAFGKTWSHLPNMQISLALAYHQAQQPKLARRKLASATRRYPYIISHLCSALDMMPLPKALWGVLPSTDAEKLYTNLYVTRAKDLWATPEAKALLAEVSETLDSYSEYFKDEPPAPKLEVSLEDARHVLLLDIPALIALVPRQFRTLPTAQYDVLPPPSSVDDAGLTARAPSDTPTQGGPMGRLMREFIRAASVGFLGGTRRAEPSTDTAAANNRGGIAQAAQAALAQDDDDNNDEAVLQEHDFLNTTLADADLTEENRVAILEALVETDESDLDNPELPMPTEDSIPLPSTSDPTSQHQESPSPTTTTTTTNNNNDNTNTHTHNPTVEDDPEDQYPQPPQPSPSASAAPAPPAPPTDPQRIQRHLLSTGLADLHADKPGTMQSYVSRLMLLRPTQREWTLSMVGQGTAGAGGVVVEEGTTESERRSRRDDLVASIRRALEGGVN